MVEYTRKCGEGVGEVLVMEIEQAEVRTRDMAATAEEEAGKEKRRKVGNGELRLVQIVTEESDSSDLCAGGGGLSSGDVSPSCCSSNGSTEKLKFTDLELCICLTEGNEIGTVARYDLDRRSSKPRSESKAESGELETTTANLKPSPIVNYGRTLPAPVQMPPASELEEFFATAENDLHKRFKDKYNYDIVNDTPLKGRFEWIQLKP